MNTERVGDLLFQALQAEQDGARVYEAAIRCAVNDALTETWAGCLSLARAREQALLEVFETMGLDPATRTPGRDVVGKLGHSLVDALDDAQREGPSETAQLVACECVVRAEAKGTIDWDLLGVIAGRLKGEPSRALADAYEDAAPGENEPYRTRHWVRELWLARLGMAASFPAPEGRRILRDTASVRRAKTARRGSL